MSISVVGLLLFVHIAAAQFIAANVYKRDDYSTGPLSFKPFIYYVDLTLGAKKQKVTVGLDTGSDFLWVPSTAANCANCKSLGTFDPLQSQLTNNDFSATFAQSSLNAKGSVYRDTVSAAGSASVLTNFGVATQTQSTHGTLGLGRTSDPSNSFVYLLKNAGSIKKAGYSLYLDGGSNSQITFGAIDSSRYTGQLSKVPFVGDTHNAITATNVKIGSLVLESDFPIILDTGTSFSVWLRNVLEAIAKAWSPDSYSYDESKHTFKVSCDVNVTNYNKFFRVTFGSAVASVRIYDNLHSDNGSCFLNFGDSATIGTAVLGNDIMKKFYTSVNFDDGYIAVAKMNPNPGLPSMTMM